jgi:hypothetical protein
LRTFEEIHNLSMRGGRCFILSERGVQWAQATFCLHDAGLDDVAMRTRNLAPADLRPHWDRLCRTLFVRGEIVKRFTVPSANQELTLAAFEEEKWPVHLDDPLPPSPGIESKRRLHDTITRLNRHQIRPLIRFHGDGRGRGLYWELIGDQVHRSTNRSKEAAT